jgi:prophage regulatory protein
MKFTRILGWQDLRDRGIDWTRQWTLVQEKRGTFPRRIRLGVNSVGWIESEIEAWIAARSAARDIVGPVLPAGPVTVEAAPVLPGGPVAIHTSNAQERSASPPMRPRGRPRKHPAVA